MLHVTSNGNADKMKKGGGVATATLTGHSDGYDRRRAGEGRQLRPPQRLGLSKPSPRRSASNVTRDCAGKTDTAQQGVPPLRAASGAKVNADVGKGYHNEP